MCRPTSAITACSTAPNTAPRSRRASPPSTPKRTPEPDGPRSAPSRLFLRALPLARVERDIQPQHIDARLADEAESRRLDMRLDQRAQLVRRNPARRGDRVDLAARKFRRDVGIEAG